MGSSESCSPHLRGHRCAPCRLRRRRRILLGSAGNHPARHDDSATEPAATSIQPPELEDGRHFGYLQAARVTAEPREVVFDLAQFLTGEEANAAAEERDFESPVPNDYFVVNDNPRLRTVPISPKLTIDLVDWKRCCDKRFAADPARFEASFTTEPPPGGRYRGRLSAYWLTVAGGLVTAIEEQYLP